MIAGEFDVVVVGAGNAGMCAALAARGEGARVLVLPGGRSGSTVTPSGSTVPERHVRPSGDQSGIPGLPGNKSGPATPSRAGK